MNRAGWLVVLFLTAVPAFAEKGYVYQSEAGRPANPGLVAGAPIHRNAFRFSRSIPPAKGFVELPLDVHALLHSPSFSDIRVIRPDGRQVPYLLVRPGDSLRLPLTIMNPAREGQTSRHRITLPQAKLPPDAKLELGTTSRVFERHVTVRQSEDFENPRAGWVIETATWIGSDPGSNAPPFVADLTAHAGEMLEVAVDDGDNAELPVSSATLLLRRATLRFFDDGLGLTLVYGSDRIGAPSYDPSLIAALQAATPRQTVSAGPPTAVPVQNEQRGRMFFWLAMGSAVVVLITVLIGLLREPSLPS